MNRGKVYLVGAGPGDPKLLTIRGLETIQEADCIVYDRLVSPRLLANARVDAEMIYCGKLPDRHTLTQEEINQVLVEKALDGKIVTRLKGGDPSIFGRVGEEAEELAKHDIPFEIVPGITSGIAAPAYAGIPVTHRDFNSSLAIVTGHERPDKTDSSINWEKLATAVGTIIFYMGVGNLPFIREQLIKYGRAPETPVALIRWGTTVEQQTVVGTLADIVEKREQAGLTNPAIIIVGEVVSLRDRLQWFEKKPLFGKRVLVTRARSQASELSEQIMELGGEAYEFPLIKMVPPKELERLDEALWKLDQFDWVIFTSVNGVNHFFKRLRELRIDIRTMTGRLAAVGPKTAEALEAKGLTVSVLPGEFRAEGLLERLKDELKPGQSVLLPRADVAREVLPKELRERGLNVTEADTYQTVIDAENSAETAALLKEKAIHIVTFTSSSTVKNFVQALEGYDLQELLAGVQVACIGPITAQTARDLGLPVHIVATDSHIQGLVDAIIQSQGREKQDAAV
ncbi:uroporphyrinogen-III C-methyltransferase [Brevibacillus humidisoli]|uniref:uroporphyrinogen-III C-methyltransferase n=1 Tax=Brevibacillus humidisoli TaxID=2895522 RepID=UPI001E489F7E|nr:uroporphyrinogen-III C-methyltransferase [Brevibacillus humidisoli]UFJ39074.1 uroporphyrinogen-III C-methyltransferase [Brevibacillus humidisoli]